MTENELRDVANEVLRETLGAHGFEHADVQPAVDHDGEPSLFVTAHFRARAGITDGAASTRALSSLRLRLLDLGEDRFPYIRYDYPDDEILIDEKAPDETTGPH
jgi:hypothetical protein